MVAKHEAKSAAPSPPPLVDVAAPGPNGLTPNVDDLLAARSSSRASGRSAADLVNGQHRLTTFPQTLDVGEQVVGSRQLFQLQPPSFSTASRHRR
ncbi:MAG TPA: hypothetical protein VHV78_11965 [Gemmatimonadaceae bacterium]|jgi:hypothetical protein|nr:hypothetical protein [Gemmatimonadaceae bacterium]